MRFNTPILFIPSTGEVRCYPKTWQHVDNAFMHQRAEVAFGKVVKFTGDSTLLTVNNTFVVGLRVDIFEHGCTTIGYIYSRQPK